MKRFGVLLFAVAVFALSSFGQKAGAGKVDPSKTVRAAFDRLIDGIKQVDVDKVMSVYDKSDRILIFNNNGSVTNGWDNIKANVAASYGKVSNVAIDVTGVRVEMLGKTNAYVTCKWTQRQENDGKLENASGRMTLVFGLIGKDWKVIHRHTSPDNPGPTRPLLPSERMPQP